MRDNNQVTQLLNTQLEAITAELKTVAQQNVETGDWVAVPDTSELNESDNNSEADAVETWNERRALMAQLETTYFLIKHAMGKLEADTYGSCEICQQPIEAARLEVYPVAQTCKQHLEEESTLSF